MRAQARGYILLFVFLFPSPSWANGNVGRAALLFLSRFKHRPIHHSFYGERAVFGRDLEPPTADELLNSGANWALQNKVTDDAAVNLVYGYEQARFLRDPRVEVGFRSRDLLDYAAEEGGAVFDLGAFGREYRVFRDALSRASRQQDLVFSLAKRLARELRPGSHVIHARPVDGKVTVFGSGSGVKVIGEFQRHMEVSPLMGFYRDQRLIAFGRQNVTGKNCIYSVADQGQVLAFKKMGKRHVPKVRSFAVVWRFRANQTDAMTQLNDLILQVPASGRIIRLLESPDGESLIALVKIEHSKFSGHLSWDFGANRPIVADPRDTMGIVKWDIRPHELPTTGDHAVEGVTDLSHHASTVGYRKRDPMAEFYKGAIPMDTWREIDDVAEGILDLSYAVDGKRIFIDYLAKDGETLRNALEAPSLRVVPVHQ